MNAHDDDKTHSHANYSTESSSRRGSSSNNNHHNTTHTHTHVNANSNKNIVGDKRGSAISIKEEVKNNSNNTNSVNNNYSSHNNSSNQSSSTNRIDQILSNKGQSTIKNNTNNNTTNKSSMQSYLRDEEPEKSNSNSNVNNNIKKESQSKEGMISIKMDPNSNDLKDMKVNVNMDAKTAYNLYQENKKYLPTGQQMLSGAKAVFNAAEKASNMMTQEESSSDKPENMVTGNKPQKKTVNDPLTKLFGTGGSGSSKTASTSQSNSSSTTKKGFF